MSTLLSIAIAYTIGIALGLLFPTNESISQIACLLVPITGVFASLANKKLGLVVIIGALILGWVRVPQEIDVQQNAKLSMPPCTRVIEGIVAQAPVEFDDRVRLCIDMERCSPCLQGKNSALNENIEGKLYVTWLTDSSPRLKKGDRVRSILKATPLRYHANHGSRSKTASKSYYSALLVKDNALFLISPSVNYVTKFLQPLRSRLSTFWRSALPESESRLARALLLGESQALTTTQKEHFRATGAAHLLAVSGLHLGILALVVFASAKFCLLRWTPLAQRIDPGRFAALLTIPIVCIFALLTGARPPVVRACVMCVSILVARVIAKPGNTTEAVSLAAMFMLIHDPSNLSNPGFQLSFSAVITFLIILRPKDTTLLESTHEKTTRARFLTTLVNLVKASAAAFAATTPFSLFHFGYVSIIGIPINVILIPLVSLVILPGLLAASFFGSIYIALGKIIATPIGWTLYLVEYTLGQLSKLPVTVENSGLLFFIGSLILCAGVLLLTAGKRKTAICVLLPAIALLFTLFFIPKPSHKPGVLTIDFLDVGQGDSTLVTFPGGERWLFDAGGTAEKLIGEKHLLPVLRGLGVSSIQNLVLTHPDPDHVMGMPAIVRAIPVESIWDNGQGEAEGAHESYGELLTTARQKNIPILKPASFCGVTKIGDVRVSVLHPCSPDQYDPGLSFNDNSIVARISFGDISLLLPGDLSEMGEQALLDKRVLTQTDILKLGHHGSSSSSGVDFLNALRPSFAIASCDLWNNYGMPTSKVKRRLSERKIHLFRTDLQGGIKVQITSSTISVLPAILNKE